MDFNREVLLNYLKEWNKQTYNKIKTIKDKKEQEEALKYSIISYLERVYNHLEKKEKEMEQKKQDVFFVKNKLLLLPSKIKFVKASYHKEEIDKVINLINDIKKEMKNV
jgi:hypothetical protein